MMAWYVLCVRTWFRKNLGQKLFMFIYVYIYISILSTIEMNRWGELLLLLLILFKYQS